MDGSTQPHQQLTLLYHKDALVRQTNNTLESSCILEKNVNILYVDLIILHSEMHQEKVVKSYIYPVTKAELKLYA